MILQEINDLDGCKTESIDILFELEMGSMNNARVKKVVMHVLNEAFDIELTASERSDAANKIIGILSKKTLSPLTATSDRSTRSINLGTRKKRGPFLYSRE